MIKSFIQKVFAPINRWEFVLSTFLLLVITELYVRFVWFIDLNSTSPFYIIILEFLTILLIIFKRFYDICGIVLKSFIISVLVTILYFTLFFISYSTMTLNLNGVWECNNKIILLLSPIYTVILYLFLLLKKGKGHNTKFEWKLFLKRVLIFATIFFLTKLFSINFYAQPSNIDYRMYPSLELNDRLLAFKQNKFMELSRFDLVLTKEKYCLRIIGLPNENIKLKGNQIFINNKVLKDEFAFYSKNLKQINFDKEFVLDENSYLLMGDNRYYTKGGKVLTSKEDLSKTPEIYQIVNKRDIWGKIIAIHYDNYNFDNKFINKKIERNDESYVFIKKDGKFGFNPSSKFKKIFGEINSISSYN